LLAVALAERSTSGMARIFLELAVEQLAAMVQQQITTPHSLTTEKAERRVPEEQKELTVMQVQLMERWGREGKARQ
jgi:hypothetical protein